jgi:pyridoxamine 5'-phosphate oxidase
MRRGKLSRSRPEAKAQSMSLPVEVLQKFQNCLDKAVAAKEIEPTAFSLSTTSANGSVSARMLLLKGFDADGFVFYTNLESDKGLQIAANPRAALVFFWKTINCQVRVEGRVEQVSDQQADEYFASRSRASQLGAWASQQSRPLRSRTELLKEVIKAEARYIGRGVPRPAHWSGYRVIPDMIEFWYRKRSRLHDRFRYTPGPDGWECRRLYP